MCKILIQEEITTSLHGIYVATWQPLFAIDVVIAVSSWIAWSLIVLDLLHRYYEAHRTRPLGVFFYVTTTYLSPN